MKRTFLLMSLFVGLSAQANEETDSVSLHEITISESRTIAQSIYLPQTVTVLGREQLNQAYRPSILPSLNELVPSLFVPGRNMMGYGVNSDKAGVLNLRGISSASGQLLVVIDGQPQYSGIYGHSVADIYQTHFAERVEVLRGPASVRYGSNAMGGVVNIVTRQVCCDTVATNVTLGAGGYGTVQTEATNQVRKGRFSSTVSAQYNRSDNHRPNMGFQQYGGMARLGYDISDHWKTSGMVDVSNFWTELPGPVNTPKYSNEQWITRGSAVLSVTNQYKNGNMPTSGSLNIYSNFGRHKIDDGTTNPAAPTTQYFRSRDNLAGFSMFQSVDFFKGNQTTFGLDYQHIYGRAYYTDKQTGNELPPSKASGKSHRNEIAGYVDFRQDVCKWLTLSGGLRIDHHSVSGTEWVPQGAAVLRPMEGGELKVSVSKGFRNPTMREMYLYKPANPDLGPERTMNYELSWSHELLDNRLHYGLNVFYLKGKDIIKPVTLNGAPLNMNVGDVENCGLEISADYRVNRRWSLTTNHSYIHMHHPVQTTPTYKGFAGAVFHEGRWSAHAGLQYIVGLYTDEDATEQNKEDYCLLSASVSHRVWRGLSLWLRGETLLGYRDYEPILGYPMPHATIMAGLSWNF